MSALPKSSHASPSASSPSQRVDFWRRRYIEKHVESWADDEIARTTGLSEAAVRAHRELYKLQRSPRVERLIAARRATLGRVKPEQLPALWTPRRVLRRALHVELRPLTRIDSLLAGGLFLASLLLYAVTAARTVTGEDAGELLAAAHGLGVAHPPGYPLWTLLAAGFDHLLPFGSVAWRVSMVSAVFAAGANALLLAIFFKTLRSRVAAVLGASLFALSLTHWRQAVIPEVYGLNTFLLAAMVLLALRLAERPSAARLLGLAAACGLGATNHTLAVPVAAVCAVGALAVAPKLFRRPAVIAGALLAGLAPLVLYAYLPLASAADPYMDWGNPERWDSFWRHVTRAQYASSEADAVVAAGAYGDYLRRLGVLAGSLGEQFGGLWWLPLGALGYVVLLKRQTGAWFLLLAVAWLSSTAITQYSRFSFDREHVYANTIFSIPAWAVVAWWVAGGLDAALAWLAPRLRAQSVRARFVRPLGASVAVAALTLLTVNHARLADRSNTTLVAEFGRSVLDVMEEGALYFPSSDHSTFPVLYWQAVEEYRTDVVIADKTGVLEDAVLTASLSDEDWAAVFRLDPKDRRLELENRLIRAWDGPVYFANRRDTRPLGEDLTLEPVGPVFKLMAAEEREAWWAGSTAVSTGAEGELPEAPGLALWTELSPSLSLDDTAQQVDFTVQMVRADVLYMRGFAALRANDLALAQESWSRIEGDLAPLKQIRNNIGSALAENGEEADAIAAYELALAEDPDYQLALRNIARVHESQGETDAAVARLEHAASCRGAAPEVRYELSGVLERADRLEDAIGVLETLARKNRRDPRPWREAGRLLEKGGDLKGARVAYEEALALNPQGGELRSALDRVERKDKLMAQQLADDPFGNAPPVGHEGHETLAGALASPFARAAFPEPTSPGLPGSGASAAGLSDFDPALADPFGAEHGLVSLPGLPEPPNPLSQLGWATPGGQRP